MTTQPCIGAASARRALFLLVALCLVAGSSTDAFALDPWTAEATVEHDGGPLPVGTRTFTLDRAALDAELSRAIPLLHTSASEVFISLPMPDGSKEEFAIYRSRAMSPELAAKYPEIRAFAGRGKSSQWRSRFELTPNGFSGAVWSPQGESIIQSTGQGAYGSAPYADVLQREYDAAGHPAWCVADFAPETLHQIDELVEEAQARGGVGNGDMLRTYRLAMAATGEFTAIYGGTVEGGLGRVVTIVNRVNEIWLVDLAMALELIPNNDTIIYTDGATDPYTNGNQNAMLGQNQANLDSVIGTLNYDIGHVVGTGGGGVANLGVVCTASKARGVSTWPNVLGEGFNLVVAHEMGHQFSAGHTWNGNTGNCTAGQWSGGSAYEPGSGSTIMSYAGSCPGQDYVFSTAPWYHTGSYSQILSFVTIGNGSICPTITPLSNSIPVATSDTDGYFIPIDTPFRLDGTATDADLDELLYSWEEVDLGPQGDPENPVGTAPLFRVFDPRDKTFRDFPRLPRTVSNTHVIGELLPTYTRRMRFRIHVRDGVGGAHWKQVRIDSEETSGPFVVTSQATAEIWAAGSSQTVTWDVADSDNPATVNCQTVNILFADNQFAYDTVLASGVPNNGSATITAPGAPTTLGRVMVQAADNVFYDVNDVDITIEGTTDVPVATISSGMQLYAPQPNPFGGTTSISFTLPSTTDVRLNVYDAAGRLVRVLREGVVGSGVHNVTWDGTSRSGSAVAPGVYFVRLSTPDAPSVNRKVHYVR